MKVVKPSLTFDALLLSIFGCSDEMSAGIRHRRAKRGTLLFHEGLDIGCKENTRVSLISTFAWGQCFAPRSEMIVLILTLLVTRNSAANGNDQVFERLRSHDDFV